MSSDKDDLSKVFGMSPMPDKSVPAKMIDVMPAQEHDDAGKVQDDYDFARANMRDLITMGMQVAAEASTVASQSGDANSFVSVAQIIKAISDTNKSLMGLSKQKMDVVGAPKQDASKTVTNNNLFVGTTADLQAFLDKTKKGE